MTHTEEESFGNFERRMWPQPVRPRCSFCDKTRAETRVLIFGAKGAICEECVMECVLIVNKNDLAEEAAKS